MTAERLGQLGNITNAADVGKGTFFNYFDNKEGVIVHFFESQFERADEAIAREKQLKRWKRDWKIELIERDNLEWRDLSDLLV